MAPAPDSKVTVVIPTHDRLALLLETLRSVTAQQPCPRIVVVDDGSTDGTSERLAGQDVEVVRNPAGGWGSGGARNAGLEVVDTPLVAFVDSDDLLLPGALEALAATLARAPEAPFAFGWGLAARRAPGGWTADGVLAPWPSERDRMPGAIYARNSVPSSGALVRTDAARAIGGYDTSLTYSEDQDFWLRLAGRAAPALVGQLVVVHRRHTGNRHSSAIASRDDDTITARSAADPRFAPALPARLGVQLCEEGLDAVRAGRPLELARAADRLVLGRRDRGAILVAAGAHFRRRRAVRAAGVELWARDAALRGWLATYD